MTPPVSDPVKDSHVDVTMTSDAKMDDAQVDVLVGMASSTTATTNDKRSLPLDQPAPLKNSDADVSMAHKDDGQGRDVLGLNVYMAKKRLLSTKASSLAADADTVEDEEAKAIAWKKTRLGWGQSLAKYENQCKEDDETPHKLVAHDGATGEAAPSHGSSPPPGSKGHGDNNCLDDMAEMRVSHVTTAPASFSKGSSRPLTGNLGNPGKNRSISCATEKSLSPAEVHASFSCKHSPPPSGDDQNFMADGGIRGRGSISQVHAVSHKGSPPLEGNNDAIAVSELGFPQAFDAPPDEISMKFTKVKEIPLKVISECSDNIQRNPRMGKGIAKMVQKPRKIANMNVFSDEQPPANELQGSKLKEWSQEEKDVFSDSIATFGTNFSRLSSFLRHKTTEDCMKYYFEHYESECHKEAQKCLPTTVMQSQENCCNKNDAATLLSGIATVTATKNYERVHAEAEDVNQICHDSTANLLAHSLPDKGHRESSWDEHEHVTGNVLVGESNAASSPLGMRSSQAACLSISKTVAPVLANFNENNSSNETVCIPKFSSKVMENIPQSILLANHGDEGNCVAGGSFGQDTLKITFYPDEISAKIANGTIKGDQVRSRAKTPELCSSLKEWNHAAKHHSRKATEKKLANSNIDDGRMAPSDMKKPNIKDNPCNTSDPAAMLTGPAFVQHMMEFDEAMEKKESEENVDKVKGKEANNPVLCVASKHGSGTKLSCEMNSPKEMEKFDSIPSPEGTYLNAVRENPTKDSSPCVASNASAVNDDGLIQRLRASEAMYRNSEGNAAKVKSKEGNPVQSFASKECNGIQLSCNVISQKGKGIMPSAEVNDLNAPPMQISNGAPKTYHLPSSSGCAALNIVHANSSYVAMDIDLNIPLGVTPQDVTLVDLGNSIAEASMDRSSEATDSDATMEINPSHTTTTVTQTAQQQHANQPGSIMLFGRVIYQAPYTGTAHHTPNQRNQIVVSSSNVPSNPVVPVIRQRGHGQVHPLWATNTTTVLRNSVPNNQQGEHAMLSNRVLYGGSTNGASASAVWPLQPGAGSSVLVNMMNQQRQQALANIMRGRVSVMSSPHLMQGSSGGAGLVNFHGFNSVPRQWSFPVVDTSGTVLGYPIYYLGATANQAPATAIAMPPTGTNNGEGTSTSNTRAPPAAGRGRGGCSSWLSLGHN